MNRPVRDQDVGTVLSITNLAQTLHVLPSPGGLFDQDALIVLLMTETIKLQAEKQEEDAKKQERKARHGA